MSFTWLTVLSTVGLFLGMILVSEIGRRLRIARLTRDPAGVPRGVSLAEGAVFGLLGLVIAFTFTGAVSRFQDRRSLVTDEANAIGTAYLRLDLLPDDTQPEIRELFRRYLDLRLATYVTAMENATTQAQLADTEALQEAIWTRVRTASLQPEAPSQAAMLLLPALNEMFDIRTTRVMVTRNHPPEIVFILLGGLCLTSAFLVGYGISSDKERAWLHTAVFAAVLALAVYAIIDLEFPRLGFIRVDDADRVLIDLRASID
jgi:hypothetical protein